MKQWGIVGWGILFFLAGLPLTVFCQTEMSATWKNGTADLARERTLARKAGIPLSLKELQKPMPPAIQNAAPLYTNLKWPGDADKELDAFVHLTAPTPEQIARAKENLTACQSGLASVHTAVSRPKCVFPRTMDYTNPAFIPFPQYSRMRSAARMLWYESFLMACDGRYEDAVRNQALGFQIARHADSDEMLIGYLVSRAIDAITVSGLRRILLMHPDDAKLAETVRTVIEQDSPSRSLALVLKSEAAFQQDMMRPAYTEGFYPYIAEMTAASSGDSEPEAHRKAMELKAKMPQISPQKEKLLIDAYTAFMLHQMRQIIAVIDTPYPQARAVLASLAKESGTPDETHFFAFSTLPVWTGALRPKTNMEAFAAVVQAGAGILSYRAVHNGQLPQTLSEALPQIALDPFDGKPLRYRLENDGKGFVVYSIGPDGNFDGGQPGQKIKGGTQSLFFRYPLAP
jgi:hypothetical protein